MLSQINILITRQELDPNLARGSFCLGAIYGIIWHHNHHVGPHSKDVILNRVIQYLKNRSMSGFQTWIDSLNKVKREISAISLSKSLEGSIFWSIYWCSRRCRWNYKRRIWVENWVSVPCIGCQCYSRPLWGENGLRPASYCLQMDQNFSVTSLATFGSGATEPWKQSFKIILIMFDKSYVGNHHQRLDAPFIVCRWTKPFL